MVTQENLKITAVSNEFTRLLIQYWDLLGQPPLGEFIALIPIESALEHIERAGQKKCQETGQIRLNS